MKAVIALLFGLISSTFANRIDDSVVLEFESPDSAEQSSNVGDGSSQSYNGIIIQVRQSADSSPTIALGSDIDDYDDVYCLNFVGLFEASEYDTATTTNGAFTEIDDTRIDLADANCSTVAEDETVFSISCNNVGDATLTLTFTFTQDTEGDYGLEYTISLDDYVLSDDTANLVMVQSLSECGDSIANFASAEEEDEETEEEEDDEEDSSSTSTEEPEDDDQINSEGTRRLLQDESTTTEASEDEETEEEEEDEKTDEQSTESESLESGDGLSDSSSGEFDEGFARFVVNGQALDVCSDDDKTEIDSTLVYQEDDDELHIVFAPFKCSLVLDPFYGLDESKYDQVYGESATPSTTKDNATSFTIFIASIIGVIAYLW